MKATETNLNSHIFLSNTLTKHVKQQCSICLQYITIGIVTPCKHVFCELCLVRWYYEKECLTCPNCRSITDNDNMLFKVNCRAFYEILYRLRRSIISKLNKINQTQLDSGSYEFTKLDVWYKLHQKFPCFEMFKLNVQNMIASIECILLKNFSHTRSSTKCIRVMCFGLSSMYLDQLVNFTPESILMYKCFLNMLVKFCQSKQYFATLNE